MMLRRGASLSAPEILEPMKHTVQSGSTPFPRRKRLRLPHFDYAQPGFAYFLTLCVKDSRPVFRNEGLAKAVLSILHEARSRFGVQVYAHCLMSDHLHLVVSFGAQGRSLSDWFRDFKRLTTRAAWRFGIQGALWQRSFYDHVIRRDEDLHGVRRYVLENPVRAGLVERAEDYPFSGMPDAIPF